MTQPLTGLPISRAAIVRALDRRLIDGAGIPSALLMEHAGHLVADAILARYPQHRRAVVLCGPGNNGGDGYVIARHLACRGLSVLAIPVLPPRTEECRLHHDICQKLGLIAPDATDAPPGTTSPALWIDALYGTGQRAPLSLPPIPALARRGADPLIAVDVPTGLDADTGARTGDFPMPDLTVCIGRLKPFLLHHALPWTLCDIGLALRAPGLPDPDPPEAVLTPPEDPWPCPPLSSKWDRGRLSILAGSARYPGAAVLCCLGALRGGAGLVTLHAPRDAWPRLSNLPPEVMLTDVPDDPAWLPACDALVIGPGLGPGLGRDQDALARHLWLNHPAPLLADADALRAIDPARSPHPRLITPHSGEAAALLGSPWRDLETDRLRTARRLSDIAPCIYKGAHPLAAIAGSPIAAFEGALPQLGIGGSGDALAGLCGALMARSRPVDDAGMLRVATQAISRQIRAAQGAGVGWLVSEMVERF